MYFTIKNRIFVIFLVLPICLWTELSQAQTVLETQQKLICPEPRSDMIWKEWQGGPLLQAVVGQDINKMKILLKSGGDVRETDSRGNPPLRLLFRRFSREPMKKSPERVKWEIRKDNKAQIQMLKLLLSYNADPNQKGGGGETPLHGAIRQSGFSIQDTKQALSMLLNKGADINSQDDEGVTILMIIARSKNTENSEIIRFLLAQGANPDLVDCHGKTALSMAQKKGNNEIVKLLEPRTNK